MAADPVDTVLESKSFMIEQEPFYLPQGDEMALFEAAYENKLPVMLVGPTGSGKTRLVEHMAWRLGRTLFTVACHSDLNAGDLTGRYIIQGDQVRWIDGPLLMAVQHGGISYLDEVVEARKDVTVVIHPLTDHRRYMVVEKQGRIHQAPDTFMLVMSYNPNYQSIIKELKPSTRQRFLAITLEWPKPELEAHILHQETGVDHDTAEKLVKAAGKIRNLVHQGLEEGVSTRELVYAATLLQSGVSRRSALSATMVASLTYDQDLKGSILEVLKNYFDLG
ncbi:CbbQ/NirQ/NorQ/GpvN family protein [Desulfatitalea alkaliphila]|uniref:CbbQ/NirQ/NorQ/GpvN family protein n=1 Tax=Desulfatitalea alkaliphila TaxID=2929485 RepID=A0AA41QZJ6_9BACT|nr:CbbQ/NirQ/NorQ/GpvN family protein [Desulfatitalea alkaliphila]MCJ8499234.1 CbbQ/NirQ/NorQ/GpvN family protein [Desulfatitalea alkaliphila]